MQKKMQKKIGIAAICLVLLTVFGVLFLNSRFVKQKILSSLKLSLQKSQGIQFTVESFDYNLLKLQFTFTGVQLQKSDKSSWPPAFQAEAINVNIPLSLLLRRRLRIQDVEIINPEIHLQIDQDGDNNFPFQTGAKKSSQTQTIIPDFLIEHFEVKNAQINFIDKRNNLELGLSNIWIKGEGQDYGMHSFQAEMKRAGMVTFQGRSFPIERCIVQTKLDKAGMDIEKLFLASVKNELELSGRIGDFSSLFFEGSMQGYLDVKELRSLMAVDDPLSGKVEILSNMKGPLKELEARINLDSQDLSYGKIEQVGMNAELYWKDRALEVLSFDLSKEKGKIHGEGILHPLNWGEHNYLNLEWNNLNVEPFMDLIQSPYLLSAETTGSLNLSWKGFSRDDFTGTCDVRLAPKEISANPEKGAPLSGRIVAKVDSGQLDITRLDISIPDADLKGKLHLSSDELTGDFELEVQSVGKMIPLILAYARNLDEKDVQRLGLDGPVSVSATLGGNLEQPSVRFELKSANLEILKIKNLRVDGVALYDIRSLQIESLLIENGDARIEMTGIYPLTPAGQDMRMDIGGEALSVEELLEILGAPPKAKGNIQFKAKVEGRTDAPRIETKWSVSGASLYEEDLGGIEVEADYRNGKIIIDSLRVSKSTGVLEASGFYDLESNEFRARLLGRSFPLDGLKVAERIDRIKAELDIDLEAYGNFGDLHLKTKGRIHQIFIGTQALSDLGFEAQSERDEVLFNVEAPEFSSFIDGAVSLKSPYVLSADLSIDQMRLEDLKEKVLFFEKHDFSGLVTADAHLNVNLKDPQKTFSCEARIEQAQLKSGDRVIRNDGPILFYFGSDTIRTERLQLVGTGIKIKAEGSLPLNIPSSAKILLSAEVDLSLLNDFLPIRDCKGSLRMESKILGSLSDLEVTAVINLSDTRFQSVQFPLVVEDIQARLDIEQNLLRVESFSGRIDEALFGLKGDIPLVSLPFRLPAQFHVFEERSAKLMLNFSNWDPFFLTNPSVNQKFQNLKGTISGRIELEGQNLLPEDMSGKGLFETIQLEILGITFEQDDPTQISLERGKLSIENLSLLGGENHVNVSGTASLTGGEDLDLSLDGQLDLYLLSIFLQEGIFSGKSRFQIKITQSYRNPEIQGFLDIQDGRYQRMTPRLTLEQVSGKIHFRGDKVEIERITGVLNGGETILSGNIGLDGLDLQDANIFLKNEDSFFDFPKGLHSQVSGDLQFLSDGKVHQAAGTITILDAIYRDDFRVGSAVYNLLRRGSVQDNLREPNLLLNNLNLNVDIRIANNFIIDNNIAKAEAAADLKLTGTPNKPSLSGRASVAEGGEVYFNQNTFSVEQGTVDFINPTRIEPDLNLSARTQIQEYEIRLVVQGTPDNLTASLVSDPPLSEPNIISLLVMGRTLDSASAGVLSVAGSTALSYLNNAITGRIEQATARALGLESVRIDAGLVSTEENPEARITLGQHLARDVELVFSQDLKDSRNQMWMLNYNPSKSFNIQGIKRDNNELNLALRHEIQFGLKGVPQRVPSDTRKKKNLIMGDIRLGGQMNLPESLIFQSLKLKEGRKIDFINLQDALERIRRLYRKNDYLSYSLTAKREEAQGKLALILQIDSGPRIFLEYQGASIPKKIKREIVDTWVGSPFGQLAQEDIQQRIRSHFMEKRYYEVKVRSEERLGKKGERSLVFQIQKGPRFGKPDIRIKGNRAVSEKVIAAHLEKSGVMNSVFDKSKEWVKSIEDLYIQHGYLRPKVQHPVVHFERNGKKVSIEVSLDEGARYKVEGIEIKGLKFFKEDHILSEIGIRSGDIVSPERFNQIDPKIHELYVQNGFNHTRVQTGIQVNSDHSTADLNIDVQENQRGIITQLSIKGNEYTSGKTIQRELMFHKGDVLNFRMINDTRKRLYDLGVFERVNIDMTPIEQNDEKYFRADINVEELKPYRLRYGIQYDTETSFGVLASLVNRNFLGNADLLGTSLRLNRDERDARAFFRSPYFFSKKIDTELFMFYNRTIKLAFTLDRIGFTLQQQIKIKKSSMISYNYTFEKIDTLYPVFEGFQNMDSTDRLGTLNVAFTRDTRDDILDATRGMFLSQSLRYAPGFLGSKTKFIRYFGQYNTYQKLSDFLTYAVSVRVGLGKGLSGDLPTSERFYAGGGTTIRGFKKDELGPRDISSDLPLGGNGVFILNQEFRFPIFKKLRGVVFLDVGNVYPKISDIDFFDVRKTAGFGFRLHTPFVLIRFDWGFKLDRRPGETLSQIFFSIGQAF